MRKRVLFISNLFPNPSSPYMASFNFQQISALQEFCDLEVIAPISWVSRNQGSYKELRREENGIVIHHPTYYYPPGCMRELYGWFYYFSIRKVAKAVLSNNTFDLVYSSWLYPDAWAAAKIAKRAQLPLFVKVHGTDVNRLSLMGTLTRKSLEVSTSALKVISVSQALRNRLIELGAPSGKIEVVYNGVNRAIFFPLPRSQVREQLGIAQEDHVVLFVGNLKKDKGLEELVLSFKDIISKSESGKWRLVIIGTGGFKRKIEELSGTLLLDGRVRLIGGLTLPDIALWMNAATVLCLPSYMEGIPNVVLEAFACGTNVVATAVGGIPELDKGDGRLILVPPQNVTSLVTALNASVIMERVENNVSFPFSWRENAEQLNNIFT